MRDGTTVRDRRLGRLIHFDPRSLDHSIRPLLAAAGAPRRQRSYSWALGRSGLDRAQPGTYIPLGSTGGPSGLPMDQGNEGACTGFGWSHELLGKPKPANPQQVTARYAREQIYWEAQKIDPWPGGAYPGHEADGPFEEGSSVLAAAKVCQGLGHFKEYRWAFGLDDLILAVGYAGPAVLGIAWYDGMYEPDAEGYIHPTGEFMGYHCIATTAVSVRTKSFWLPNSWGDWGPQRGWCRLSFDDMDRLLHEEGEACIPIQRNLLK